eukprot:g12841.t1
MGAFSKLVLLAGAGQSEAVSFVGTTEQGHIDAAGWVDDAFGTTLNTTTTDDVSFLQAAERRQKSAFGKFWEGLGPEVEKNVLVTVASSIPENKYKTVLYKKYDKSVAKADSTANRRAGDSMRQEARDMFDLTMQVVMMIKNPPKFIDEAANETYAILEKEQKQTTVGGRDLLPAVPFFPGAGTSAGPEGARGQKGRGFGGGSWGKASWGKDKLGKEEIAE